MILCYKDPNDTRAQVNLEDRIRYNGELFLVSRLPAQPGDDVMIRRPNGNFQDMDFKPEALGMEWRA